MLVKPKFIEQANRYWERRYKEDENLDVSQAPKNTDAIKELVSMKIEEAMKLASDITNIKHLNEDDEKITIPAEAYISLQGDNTNGMINVPNLRYNHPENVVGQPPQSSVSTYSSIDDIDKGGFVLELFMEIDLYEDMKDWVVSFLGNDFST